MPLETQTSDQPDRNEQSSRATALQPVSPPYPLLCEQELIRAAALYNRTKDVAWSAHYFTDGHGDTRVTGFSAGLPVL
jgi:hypothetical protein